MKKFKFAVVAVAAFACVPAFAAEALIYKFPTPMQAILMDIAKGPSALCKDGAAKDLCYDTRYKWETELRNDPGSAGILKAVEGKPPHMQKASLNAAFDASYKSLAEKFGRGPICFSNKAGLEQVPQQKSYAFASGGKDGRAVFYANPFIAEDMVEVALNGKRLQLFPESLVDEKSYGAIKEAMNNNGFVKFCGIMTKPAKEEKKEVPVKGVPQAPVNINDLSFAPPVMLFELSSPPQVMVGDKVVFTIPETWFGH